jgi:hypothetical protein
MKRTLISLLAATALLPAATGLVFLKIPVDAAVCGAGEAAAAWLSAPSALYYNPAGLGRVQSFAGLAMHNEWFLGMRHEYVAAGWGTPEMGGVAASFNYWTSGDLQGITWRGDTIPGYVFSASDWSVALGYGRSFGPFAVGAGAKFVQERNDSLVGTALAFDAGVMYRPPVEGLQAGVSVANLGPKFRLDQDRSTLPWTVRAGCRYDYSIAGVTADVIYSPDERPGFAVGAEVRPVGLLALRVGYRSGSDVEGLAHLRAGLGVSYLGIGLDYAFAPYGALGMTHRLSLSYRSPEPEFEE